MIVVNYCRWGFERGGIHAYHHLTCTPYASLHAPLVVWDPFFEIWRVIHSQFWGAAIRRIGAIFDRGLLKLRSAGTLVAIIGYLWSSSDIDAWRA